MNDTKQVDYKFEMKDDKIFVNGNNDYGQLGTGKVLGLYSKPISKPKRLHSDYFNIWGWGYEIKSRAKSARK